MTDDSFLLGPASREAEFDSRCPACGGDVTVGEPIFWSDDMGLWCCEGCIDA